MMLLAGGKLLIATTFAGLNAIPVVLLVRQALLAREDTGSAVAWFPPGLLSPWLTGLGLAVAAVVVLVLGGVDDICVALRHALASALDSGLDVNAEGIDEVLSPDMAALGLRLWIPALLAFSVGATLLGGAVRFLAFNVMTVLAVSFCLAGLAVLHTLVRRLARPAAPFFYGSILGPWRFR